jgi:hypothetical protein
MNAQTYREDIVMQYMRINVLVHCQITLKIFIHFRMAMKGS